MSEYGKNYHIILSRDREKYNMLNDYNILSEIASAVIGFVSELSLNSGFILTREKIEKFFLIQKFKKKEKELIKKYTDYSNSFYIEKVNKSFYRWLKEKKTIYRIMSFSNTKNMFNMDIEQMLYSKEIFLNDACNIAEIYNLNEKEKLRNILNDIMQYVDELFWKDLDEKNVYLYKNCILQIRELIEKFTENIIQEIQYNGSFAEYINNQKVIQETQYRLDYRSEEIPFVGRRKELSEIQDFCNSDQQISWWAIIGNGGSGKSRLAYQYIKENINSSEWKMLFLRNDFFKQVNGDGKYNYWNSWIYDKNLLLVVDYIQKNAREVAQWIEDLNNNISVSRKIRVLMLERTCGEKALWYKGIFDKPLLLSLQYKKKFLELYPMEDSLIHLALKYAEKSKKKISEIDAKEAFEKLKILDPDMRILYYIILLEAISEEATWKNWNKTELIKYIIDREQGFIDVRFNNDRKMIQVYNRLLAFCTATREMPFFDLPSNIPEIIKRDVELLYDTFCDKDKLYAVMLLKDDAIQPFTPNVIGEYMVLYTIDRYLIKQSDKEQFVYNLWLYDPENFAQFIFRLMEEKKYESHLISLYDDIVNLMLFRSIPHDNTLVIQYYSILMRSLTVNNEIRFILLCIKVLESLYMENPHNNIVIESYVNGLLNLCQKQELNEMLETMLKVKELYEKNIDNSEIQKAYAGGLVNLSAKLELLESQKNVEKLKKMAEKHVDNEEIEELYVVGLVNLSSKQDVLELKKTVVVLELLAEKYLNNLRYQELYLSALINLSERQGMPERIETIIKMGKIAERYVESESIQIKYANELVRFSRKQEMPEIQETIIKLNLNP